MWQWYNSRHVVFCVNSSTAVSAVCLKHLLKNGFAFNSFPSIAVDIYTYFHIHSIFFSNYMPTFSNIIKTLSKKEFLACLEGLKTLFFNQMCNIFPGRTSRFLVSLRVHYWAPPPQIISLILPLGNMVMGDLSAVLTPMQVGGFDSWGWSSLLAATSPPLA